MATERPLRAVGGSAKFVLGLIAGGVLLAMMMLTFFDVLARNVIKQPIRGAFELTELLLAVLIFAGLPLLVNADEHVRVDIIRLPLGPTGSRIIASLSQLTSGFLLGGVAYLLWQRALRFAEYGDHTSELGIPIAPFLFGVSVLTAVSGLIHVQLAFNAIRVSKSTSERGS